MTFKHRLKWYLIVLSKSAVVLLIRLVITALDAVFRAGMWLGPHIKTLVAKLINFQRKVNRPNATASTSETTAE